MGNYQPKYYLPAAVHGDKGNMNSEENLEMKLLVSLLIPPYIVLQNLSVLISELQTMPVKSVAG